MLQGVGVRRPFLLFVLWSRTDCKSAVTECDKHSLSDVNVRVACRISMSQDHNLEPEGRWKFKEVKAFVQGHKVRGGIGIVLATLRKQKTETKPSQKNTLDKTKQLTLS